MTRAVIAPSPLGVAFSCSCCEASPRREESNTSFFAPLLSRYTRAVPLLVRLPSMRRDSNSPAFSGVHWYEPLDATTRLAGSEYANSLVTKPVICGEK